MVKKHGSYYYCYQNLAGHPYKPDYRETAEAKAYGRLHDRLEKSNLSIQPNQKIDSLKPAVEMPGGFLN
ncbi:hypothetical protein [Domibacillus indicus]|uniref:hypothetical protein n=1 Tax=Domibacillus indicus TaxID=1437523 RepID=UPI0006180A03|nr:hypothetical protein [Domibacillus indicus]